MTKVQRFYNFIFFWFLRPAAKLFFLYKFSGREKIPEGAAIICANHSSMTDPVLIAFAFGRGHYIHFMAKKELMTTPVVGFVLRNIDAFPVDRGANDTQSVRTAMRYLKMGEKILMFPEGTRVSEDEAVAAKTGAVRLASRLNVPIIPVHIPRRKGLFSRPNIGIGDPICIEKPEDGDYTEITENLMRSINTMAGA